MDLPGEQVYPQGYRGFESHPHRRINMSPVEEIKSRLDIVEFIRGYLKLEKVGQNWRALCPFHHEKTPSFFVSPSRQSWHCFGACQSGGDIFSFLMKIENIEFPEALKILAQKAGVTLSKEDPKLRSERNRLQSILESSTKFYEKNLASFQAAKEYLKSERGLKEETIKTFRIGWATNEYRGLLEHLVKLGFQPQEIERAGLITRSENGGYLDRFRSRIMFPIFDSTGRVVGFTGRIFAKESEDQAKYLNTPETILFQKSKILYGLHLAKSAIARENFALLVEGQMDFLAAWQEGIQNVIATSGTALTNAHLRQLRRICDTLILGFDMDAAGESATERGVLLAASNDFTLKILTLPQGKDIADFVNLRPGKLPELLKSSKHLMQYYFEKLQQKYDLNNIFGKKQAIAYIMPRLKTLASASERALWINELSFIMKIKEDILFEELQRSPSLLENEFPTQEEKPSLIESVQKTRKELLAERALAFAVCVNSKPPFFAEYISYFPEKYREAAYEIHLGSTSESDFVNYLLMLSDYERSINPDLNIIEELELTLRELKREALKEKISLISSAIKDAERLGDETQQKDLLQEFNQLTQELRSL